MNMPFLSIFTCRKAEYYSIVFSMFFLIVYKFHRIELLLSNTIRSDITFYAFFHTLPLLVNRRISIIKIRETYYYLYLFNIIHKKLP
jgi:hypothetical protein